MDTITPTTLRAAIRHLRRADPKLALVLDHVGSFQPARQTDGTHFDAVMRAIVYQQLSGKAASTIHGRVFDLFGGRAPAPDELKRADEHRLRAAGLSRQKIAYMKDLATRVADGALPIEQLHELEDDDVLTTLTSVKGVGTWTAQMFLMFRLGRPDVLPVLDLGIQKAVRRAYGLRKHPTPDRVAKIGEPWRPYRSVASWYLWRYLDNR